MFYASTAALEQLVYYTFILEQLVYTAFTLTLDRLIQYDFTFALQQLAFTVTQEQFVYYDFILALEQLAYTVTLEQLVYYTFNLFIATLQQELTQEAQDSMGDEVETMQGERKKMKVIAEVIKSNLFMSDLITLYCTCCARCRVVYIIPERQ